MHRRRTHLVSAAGRAAAPLVVDDHLGSAAGRPATPLSVDDHLGSAAGRAAAPLVVDYHLGSAASGVTTPLVPIILTSIWLQAWIAGCPLTEPGWKSGGRNVARR